MAILLPFAPSPPLPSPPDDLHFPFARMKDWWTGHSWASGTDVSDDAKSQGSSSEAVNGYYYAVALLGSALGDASLETYGKLLAAMEVSSAQEYWQVGRMGRAGGLMRVMIPITCCISPQ